MVSAGTGRTIAVIPARGGSKRIPGKNILNFFGKPLMAWTIEAALESGIFDRVLVSTDDEEIAASAQDLGVDVPFLRDQCSDDHSMVSSATIRALEQVEDILGEQYQTVVQLMPNCPLRGSKHIVDAFEHFEDSEGCLQISCFKFGWMNPWWASKLDKDLCPELLFPDALKKRSQDLPDLYCPTGAIWIARVDALKSAGSFYGEGLKFWPMEWQAAVDIDDVDDLKMAKALFTITQSENQR